MATGRLRRGGGGGALPGRNQEAGDGEHAQLSVFAYTAVGFSIADPRGSALRQEAGRGSPRSVRDGPFMTRYLKDRAARAAGFPVNAEKGDEN